MDGVRQGIPSRRGKVTGFRPKGLACGPKKEPGFREMNRRDLLRKSGTAVLLGLFAKTRCPGNRGPAYDELTGG